MKLARAPPIDAKFCPAVPLFVYASVTDWPMETEDGRVKVTVPGLVVVPDVLAMFDGVTDDPSTLISKSAMVAVPDAIASLKVAINVVSESSCTTDDLYSRGIAGNLSLRIPEGIVTPQVFAPLSSKSALGFTVTISSAMETCASEIGMVRGVFAPLPPVGVNVMEPVPAMTFSENVSTMLALFDCAEDACAGEKIDTMGTLVSCVLN